MSPGSGLEGTESLYETMRRMDRCTRRAPDYELMDLLKHIDELREERRFLLSEIDRVGRNYSGNIMVDEVQLQFRMDIGRIDKEIVNLIGQVEKMSGMTMAELFKPEY
jgi:hypothetical protein